MNAKQAAAEKAVEFVRDGMVLGLGTGSTVQFALERIARRIGEGLRVQGIPTSRRTEAASRELGIPLLSLDRVSEIDLTIDGADEVDPRFALIKGGGGALLREKIVASLSRLEVIAVSRDKLVEKLGAKFLLPVEVLPFGWKPAAQALEQLGSTPFLRKTTDGETFITDNGNYILDCRFDPIEDPAAYDLIQSYSPYDQVSAKAYPPILATGGLSDPRVTYWEPAKWVAKLRESSTGDAPILLKINMEAGHGGASGRFDFLKEIALDYAFAIWAVEGPGKA